MNRQLVAAAATLCVLATAACGGNGASGVTPPATQASGTQSNFDWGQDQLRGAQFLGSAVAGMLHAYVLVRPQNAQGLLDYAQQANDPGSPLFRHWLEPQDIANRFGASDSDYRAAANYFAQEGLSVGGWPQHLALVVAGSQSSMEKAFGTKFGVYQKNGRQFVAPMSAPHFASPIPVAAVEDLVTLNLKHTYIIPAPPHAGAGTNAGYSPQQIRNAFDFNNAYLAGYDGSGITVGIIGTGPINVGNRSNLCDDRDLDAFKTAYNVSAAQVCETDVTNNGVFQGLGPTGLQTAPPNSKGGSPPYFPASADFQPPPAVTGGNCTGGLPACNPEDGEAQLDTQQIATLAHNASVKFYLAYNGADCSSAVFPNQCPTSGKNAGTPQIGLAEADAEIEEAIGENSADILSLSYGGGELQAIGSGFNAQGNGLEPMEFAALAAEGIAVFVSSGDSGSAECLGFNGYLPQVCVSYPSGDPNVSSVGGVNIPLDAFGQITGNITAWGTTTSLGTSGSGGGVSQTFAAPPWQQSAIGATKRTQPDVAMVGDPRTGVALYTNAGLQPSAIVPSGLGDIGGTSVAAPQMAAMWALVLDACKVTAGCGNGPSSHSYRLGNAAPYLYSIYKGANLTGNSGFSPHLPYANVFYDVVFGSNSMCPVSPRPCVGATPIPGQSAGPGYDQTTGVGVPFAGHLIDAIVNPASAVP